MSTGTPLAPGPWERIVRIWNQGADTIGLTARDVDVGEDAESNPPELLRS
jgi:hypothetical protein